MQSGQKIAKSADDYIKEHQLDRHPFGCGYFRETDRNPLKIKIKKNTNEEQERNLSTTIIALFKGNQKNPLHRTSSTQIIHFYHGGNSDLLVHIIESNGSLKTHHMSSVLQLIIPASTWFAFEVEDKNDNSFVITGHTVSPGFDNKDFELANRKALCFQYPKLAAFVEKFTLEPERHSERKECVDPENQLEKIKFVT